MRTSGSRYIVSSTVVHLTTRISEIRVDRFRRNIGTDLHRLRIETTVVDRQNISVN